MDVAIAPLLEALWNAGYPTFGSCQEFRPGTARIWFKTREGREALRDAASWSADVSGDGFTVDFLAAEIDSITALIPG